MLNEKNWTWYEKYKYWREGKTVVRIGLELFRRAKERNDTVEMIQYAGNVVSDLARMYFYCPRLTNWQKIRILYTQCITHGLAWMSFIGGQILIDPITKNAGE